MCVTKSPNDQPADAHQHKIHAHTWPIKRKWGQRHTHGQFAIECSIHTCDVIYEHLVHVCVCVIFVKCMAKLSGELWAFLAKSANDRKTISHKRCPTYSLIHGAQAAVNEKVQSVTMLSFIHTHRQTHTLTLTQTSIHKSVYILHIHIYFLHWALIFKIIPGITTGENEIMQWAKRQMYFVIKNQFSTPAPLREREKDRLGLFQIVHFQRMRFAWLSHHFFPLPSPLCFIVVFAAI